MRDARPAAPRARRGQPPRNDYVFERAVTFHDGAGKSGHGRIDLYKRGSFVLEAKQSCEPCGKKEVALPPEQTALPGFAQPIARGPCSAQCGCDVLMRNAREPAEQCARALPLEHGGPPFILMVDVGHAIEVFADFSGQGKNYRQFPDRSGFRIYLDDLRHCDVRARSDSIPLYKEEIGELYDAAKHIWTEVEPAIFGTPELRFTKCYRSDDSQPARRQCHGTRCINTAGGMHPAEPNLPAFTVHLLLAVARSAFRLSSKSEVVK